MVAAPVESSRVFPGGGGSSRDPRAHGAILRATRELLVGVGYSRLTIEAVAARAGVGKPTIYRWWRNKAALVHEAIAGDPPRSEPDTGELAHDLGQWVARVFHQFTRPEVLAALPGLLADISRDDATMRTIEAFSRPGLDHLADILGRAGVDRRRARTISDMVIGTIISRGTTTTSPPGRAGWQRVRRELTELIVGALTARA